MFRYLSLLLDDGLSRVEKSQGEPSRGVDLMWMNQGTLEWTFFRTHRPHELLKDDLTVTLSLISLITGFPNSEIPEKQVINSRSKSPSKLSRACAIQIRMEAHAQPSPCPTTKNQNHWRKMKIKIKKKRFKQKHIRNESTKRRVRQSNAKWRWNDHRMEINQNC